MAFVASAQNIVINEIMYHPASQDVREEFVELFNAGPTNVNLTGWTLSGGIAFTFPNITINAGSYFVVAANTESFNARYPSVLNYTGGWLTYAVTNVNGRFFTNFTPTLSNTRNSINLNNAAGTRIDEVTYADSGDWAVRRRGLNDNGYRGWIWYAEHDGLGKSLELINPALPNDYGQNWGSSTTAGGTPGTANSIRSTNIAPLIIGAQHLPVIPRSTENISINARILDESATGLAVTLRWRLDGSPSFASTNMLDNGASGDGVAGDGIYGAVLGAQANSAIVEFYIEAADAQSNTRTWPAPALQALDQGNGSLGQAANALLQVDNSTQLTNSAPLYKLILTAAEQTELGNIFGADNFTISIDAEMNCTFLSLDGGGIDRRYLCGTRNRGHGSRQGTPHNYRIDFPADTPWKGVTGFNMNARTVPAQVVGAAIAQKAGAAGNNSRFARFRVNNGTGPGGAPTDGLYACNEDMSSDWAGRQFPDNGGGNIYSVVRDIAPKEFNYRGETPASYQNTYFKQSNVSEDDWRDLIGMLQVMGDNQTGAFTMSAARSVANIDQWLVHLAVMNLFGNAESGINTGNNDDYYWYRGVNDPRFIMVYHDLDSVLGLGSLSANDTNIFSATFCCASGDTVGIAAAMRFFMHHPQIEPLYYRTLQNLLDGPFSAAQFNSTVDQILNDFPHLATTGSGIKSWMNTRRSTVQSLINGLVPPATNNPIATVTGEPRSPTWRTTATLTVGGTNITHYQWRLNSGAWSAETPVATPISLSSLASGSTNTVQVVGRNSGGIYQSTAAATVSKTWVVNTALPTVRLNEVMARNDSAVSHFGTFPDMIELFNEGGSTVTLTGMRLTDDPANPGKYTFPATTTLAAGAYLILYADSAVNPGQHTDFTLGANGDGLFLFNTVASGGALLDSVSFGQQAPNLSIGRFGTTGDWALAQPSFGATNVVQSLGNARGLKLNEWLAASVPPSTEDFIELYNPDPLPVAMGGMYLTDEPLGAPALHRVADLSFVAGGGYLVFIADGSAGAGPDHVNFGLAAEQGQIGLMAADLSPIDCVVYGPQRTDVSTGRCPNGSGTVGAQNFTTAGLPNSCAVPPPPAQTVTLLPVNQTWTYNTNGVLPAVDWMVPGYNDSGWNGSGPAMLGRVANTVPEPVSTPLAQNNNIYTYYFRTHFNVPANANYTSLVLSNLIDDGGVFYINGVEVGRIRLPAAPAVIDPNTPATSITATTWSLSESGTLSLTNLHPGDNVMAVEVHQNNASSMDNIMAMRLNALIVTNAAASAGIVISEVLANNATVLNVDGRTPDFIEFYNPSTNAIDLAGLSVNDSPDNNLPKWVFPAGSIIPARGYFTLFADNGAPASSTNTGFGLGAKGGAVYLFKKAPDTNEILDRVVYGLQTADFSIGRIPIAGTNWVLTLPTPGLTNAAATLGNQASLRLNEWMADPTSGDDWFEVFNPGNEPVLLSGLRLTDTYGYQNSYVIPALSFIGLGSNAFQRFEADDPSQPLGPEHVNFKLSAAADAIFLLASNNATVIDSVSWAYSQEKGVSEGRLPDGSSSIVRFPETATPGDANYLPLTNVVVNEILTHTDPPLEDAIELRNLTGSPLSIGGWFLSDDKDSLSKFRIPDGTTIPANGYVVFYEIAFNNDTNGTPFALSSAGGDQVYLAEAQPNGALTGMRAVARFGPSANGVSFGRYVNSIGEVDHVAMSARSFGVDSPLTVAQFRTGTGAANPYPKVGPVVVSEIMYHPPDIIVPGVSTNDNLVEEFIELRNISGATVPLYDPAHTTNGWRLRDAVDFTFNSAHTIPAGGHLLVVGFDPVTNAAALAQFRSRYGTNSILVGPYSGKLDNSSDSVELVKPDPPQPNGDVPYVLVEKIVYRDTPPWATNADGSGMSLQRLSQTGYANDPTNWVADAPSPGPAGQLDTDGDGMPDAWESQNGLSPTDSTGLNGANGDPDGDGFTNLQEYLAGTDPQSGGSTLRLTATRNGGNVDLSFTAVAGRTYTILRCSTMSSGGSWTPWMNVPAQGGTGPVTVQDALSGGTQRFYRVVTPAMP
jgi:hypothetical protein